MGNAKLLVSALGKILVFRIWFVRLVIILLVRLGRMRFWWLRLVPRSWSRFDSSLGILLLLSLEFLSSSLLPSQSFNLRTDNTSIERTSSPSMRCILGPQSLYFLGSLVLVGLVLVLPIALVGVTGLGVLGLLGILAAFAPLGVLGFLARTFAVLAPLTTSVITSGLEVATVVLARGIRLGPRPRTLG